MRRDAKYAALLVLSLIAGQLEARAQSSDARLTPDERQRLVAAYDKVRNNPAVHVQLETILRREMLATDNSLGSILAKIKVGDLEEIRAASDPADRAIEALSKTTEKLELRDQQQAEAEMHRKNVYEATAKKVAAINPNHKDAESEVEELKLSAGPHLDSGQMQQLFSRVDRGLASKDDQLQKIRKETGYDGDLIYDFFTGMVDWTETRAVAEKFAAQNSARENEKPPEETPQLAPVALKEIAPPIPPRSSVVNPSPLLLSVAVVALLSSVGLLCRRKPVPREIQGTDQELVSNEAWFFADCPSCEWRHTRPEGTLETETNIKCASCGSDFEPKWGKSRET